MLQVNDYVVFGSTGVCQIAEIVEKSFSGMPAREYYVLRPVYGNNETVYLPTDHNQEHFRRIHTKEEILALIQELPDIDSEWVEDDSLRKNMFTEMLHSCETRKLAQWIKMIHHRKIELEKRDKKLSGTDADAMKIAEKLLYNELALILELEPDQVLPFILGQIES